MNYHEASTSSYSNESRIIEIKIEGCQPPEPPAGDYIPWDNDQNVVTQDTELLVDRIKSVSM